MRIDHIEYAVSDGEGTLLAYGAVPYYDMSAINACWNDKTLITAPCTEDCETGKFPPGIFLIHWGPVDA